MNCALPEKSYVSESEPHKTFEGKFWDPKEIHADGQERKMKGFE
jgi:hypothetical protein